MPPKPPAYPPDPANEMLCSAAEAVGPGESSPLRSRTPLIVTSPEARKKTGPWNLASENFRRLPFAIVIVLKLKMLVFKLSFNATGSKYVTPGAVMFKSPSTPVDLLSNGVPSWASERKQSSSMAGNNTQALAFPLVRLL